MSNDLDIKPKPVEEIPHKTIEGRAKEHKPKPVNQSEKESIGLKLGDYMRIAYNGVLTVLQNVVKGKAPFGEVKPNIILWVTILSIVLLIIEKVF